MKKNLTIGCWGWSFIVWTVVAPVISCCCEVTGVVVPPDTIFNWFEFVVDVVFGEGCGTAASPGLFEDVGGCGRGDTTEPRFKAFLPLKLYKEKWQKKVINKTKYIRKSKSYYSLEADCAQKCS